MSKRSSAVNKAKGKVAYTWVPKEGGFAPIIQVGNLQMELETRPERVFLEGEREATMFQIANAVAKELWGCYRYIPNEHGHIVENPAWAELETATVEDVEPENQIVGLDGKPVETK